MAYIPKGRYLTVNEFRKRLGLSSNGTIIKAVKEGRITGAIWIDKNVCIIPEDAIMVNKSVKSGKYMGVSAWLRGEIEHQEELKNWEQRQEQLRRMRKNDKR
jgi:hypothetical protein